MLHSVNLESCEECANNANTYSSSSTSLLLFFGHFLWSLCKGEQVLGFLHIQCSLLQELLLFLNLFVPLFFLTGLRTKQFIRSTRLKTNKQNLVTQSVNTKISKHAGAPVLSTAADAAYPSLVLVLHEAPSPLHPAFWLSPRDTEPDSAGQSTACNQTTHPKPRWYYNLH